jgi:hypothetical protein
MIKEPITIEGKEYKLDDLPPEAQKMVRYIAGIDEHLNNLASQIEVSQIGRDGCYKFLLEAIASAEQKVAGQN